MFFPSPWNPVLRRAAIPPALACLVGLSATPSPSPEPPRVSQEALIRQWFSGLRGFLVKNAFRQDFEDPAGPPARFVDLERAEQACRALNFQTAVLCPTGRHAGAAPLLGEMDTLNGSEPDMEGGTWLLYEDGAFTLLVPASEKETPEFFLDMGDASGQQEDGLVRAPGGTAAAANRPALVSLLFRAAHGRFPAAGEKRPSLDASVLDDGELEVILAPFIERLVAAPWTMEGPGSRVLDGLGPRTTALLRSDSVLRSLAQEATASRKRKRSASVTPRALPRVPTPTEAEWGSPRPTAAPDAALGLLPRSALSEAARSAAAPAAGDPGSPPASGSSGTADAPAGPPDS